jgi:hypothetical protein
MDQTSGASIGMFRDWLQGREAPSVSTLSQMTPDQASLGGSAAQCVAPEVQQMQDMLAIQVRLREAAQLNRATAVRALIGIAEATCVGPWDEEKRSGRNPEDWPPERIGEFVIRHLRLTLRSAALAKRPELAEQYERLAQELADARQEVGRLRVQLQYTQAAAQRPAEGEPRVFVGQRRGARVASHPSIVQSAAAEPVTTQTPAPRDQAAPQPRVDELVRLMAASGLARDAEIRRQLAARWGTNPAGTEVVQAIVTAIHGSLVAGHACAVDWAGDKSGQFLTLTPAGSTRARELGVEPAGSEFELGLRRSWSAEHLYLALTAAEILGTENYTDVNLEPDKLKIDGTEFCPDLAAREGGAIVHIECPVSRSEARAINWKIVAKAGDGIIRLVTPTRKTMDAVTSEIKASVAAEPTIWASNVADYLAGQRGPNGTFWIHQR